MTAADSLIAETKLRDEMHAWRGTSVSDIVSAGHPSGKNRDKLRRQREFNDNVFNEFIDNDYTSQDEAVGSVIASLGLWFCQWLLKAIVKEIVVWLWNKTHPETGAKSDG